MRRTRHLAPVALRDGPPPTITVRSHLTGAAEELSLADLGELSSVSARSWTWRVDELARSLAVRGLLVSDEHGEPFERLRRRDTDLSALGWHPAAAAFHLETWWDGTRLGVPSRDGSARKHRPRVGPPQPPFYERGGERIELASGERRGDLSRLLRARRTTRSFGVARPVTSEELATILRAVWGVDGTAQLARGDTALRRSSPSGGGLHAIEVYPIVRRVEGVPPGVYHYRVRDHQLERLASLDADASGRLIENGTAGQWYFGDADVGFVLTARFARSYWKYRRHAKIFRALLVEAGHFSQTFYLACTDLGLGPFVTAALDDGELARALELDPLFEAPLALCGCGRLPQEQSRLDPVFRPLDPGLPD
ncbi:MAG: putative peptide maturation dehydrogenase [Gaiellaceae bacterium]